MFYKEQMYTQMTKKTFMLQKLLTVEISRDWWWILINKYIRGDFHLNKNEVFTHSKENIRGTVNVLEILGIF